MARILWNIHLYPPKHNCGSEYVAHTVNKYLLSKGHQVRVLLQQYKGPMYDYEGVEVFPATGNMQAFAWGDVLLTHLDFTQHTCLMSMSVKRPTIHFVHNDITYASIANGIRGHHIVYNSEWIRERVGYSWPSVVLHPPCFAKDYIVDNTNAAAVTLISLNQMKGGLFLYDIARAMPEQQFIGVIGSYDSTEPVNPVRQEEIVNRLAELPNIRIVPNSPDILSVYRKTRVLIMPSLYESWGRTATEAMHNGIPVIATPTRGLRENLSYAGLFIGKQVSDTPGEPQVSRGSVAQWVKAIRSLNTAKTYDKYSVLCKRRAAELDPSFELERLEQFILNARF
jgi:glycosyltransferase involved in cell wall biosynthesis